jgi:hypothetical protein
MPQRARSPLTASAITTAEPIARPGQVSRIRQDSQAMPSPSRSPPDQ